MVNCEQGMEPHIHCCILTSAQTLKNTQQFQNNLQQIHYHQISNSNIFHHHCFPINFLSKNRFGSVEADARSSVFDFYGVNEST